MNAQLNHILAQQRISDLRRDAERARLAIDAGARRRDSRDSNPVTRVTAQVARLTARLAPTGVRDADDPARTALARDLVVEMSTPVEPSRADGL
jgi:hypothetical protein